MWGTKPPMLIWWQAIFMNLLGPGNLAVRLPSALGGLMTVTMLFVLAYRKLGGWPAGLLVSICLLTARGFIDDHHSARTGDFDSLLTFFSTAYLLCFFFYLEKKQDRYLYFTVVGIICAVLTKSIASLLFGPGLFLYLILRKELLPLLRNPHFYFSALLCIGGIAAFYLTREQLNPGYLQTVWENELGGRYNETLESHKHPFFFYFGNLPKRFTYFWPLALVGMGYAIFMFRQTSQYSSRLAQYCSLSAFSYLFVISNSATKLPWYDLPAYPMLALLAAIGWLLTLQVLERIAWWQNQVGRRPWLKILLTLGVLFYPYNRTIHYCLREDPVKYHGPQAYPHFIEFAEGEKNYHIASLFYRPNVRFYSSVYSMKGYSITPTDPNHPPKAGEKLMICGDAEKKRVDDAGAQYDVLYHQEKCWLVEIK